MADTIIFTPGGTSGATMTVTPVPGSAQIGGGHEDRGGGVIPVARAAKAANGSCRVLIDNTITIAALKTLVEDTCIDSVGAASSKGIGGMEITGTGEFADVESFGALVDVDVSGDSVQEATITWKGSSIAIP